MNFFHKIVFFTKGAALSGAALLFLNSCNTVSSLKNSAAEMWLTKGDESVKLQKQTSVSFTITADNLPKIEVDPTQTFQSVDGFGYTLTGGSVEVLNELTPAKRKALLQELFGKGANAISVSYLRLSIGASDLDEDYFSYDDVPAGQTDVSLSKFSLEKNRALISMLKEILDINPKIKIIATPWSPPVWMKDNQSSVGGSLIPEFYNVYAKYFVKYIQEMAKNGITINAICPQNEPLNPKNNPSLLMTSPQQLDFIKNHLGPEFSKNNIKTKIVVYDHNCDVPEYATDILKDPEAAKYIDGSAFHLYGGEVSAMGKVHDAFPNKNLYFTEQWTGSKSDFKGDLNWHVRNVIIGTMRNWSKIALEWNLANDENFNPHTPGGCTECKGAITVSDKDNFSRNVSYYIIAHASKFIPPNSVRIASTQTEKVASAAFKTPEGNMVVILQNDSATPDQISIRFNGKNAPVRLEGQSVATLIF